MPISTSTGRAVKNVLDEPQFRKIDPGGKTKFCQVVDIRLNKLGTDLINNITGKKWGDVYTGFTELRRLIEMKMEACL